MAVNTDPALQNAVIYSVYVRAHTPEGSFRALTEDLERIRALGTDILWLMPIHPIGVVGKKGSLGCPYAIRDYRGLKPAYGSMEDFRALADAVHGLGMKLMIDVVYNHTSPDSVLYGEHPEYFYHGSDGKPGNKIGDWADVIDLDYSVPELWDYQIETLCRWAEIVDGFRCDVASFLPLGFWEQARAAVERVRPGCIWLAESVHASFGNLARSLGFTAVRDTELYAAFDMEYEYDIRTAFERMLRDELPLSAWTELLELQEALYPAGYNKLRFLENHDQPRIAALLPEEDIRDSFTAMLFFLKGSTLLYAGQEFSAVHTPSLFEKETVDRSGRDISPLLRRLAEIKRSLGPDDAFFASADDEKKIAVLERVNGEGRKLGVFPLGGRGGAVKVTLPDGTYKNRLDNETVVVKDGKLNCTGAVIIC